MPDLSLLFVDTSAILFVDAGCAVPSDTGHLGSGKRPGRRARVSGSSHGGVARDNRRGRSVDLVGWQCVDLSLIYELKWYLFVSETSAFATIRL